MTDLARTLAALDPKKRELLALLARKGGIDLSRTPILPVPRDAGLLPLSFAQERLWFLDQLAPGSTVWNLPSAVRIRAAVDPGLLAKTFAEIARRHETLRTTFATREGRPVQVIGPAGPVPLPVVDLSALPDPEPEVRRLALAEARTPFDLARGPVLRVRLLRLGPEDHALLATMHHIASDGWSMGLLVEEVSAIYGSFSQGLPSPLPKLPVQYADFAQWQRQAIQGQVLEAQLAWWRERLGDGPPVLELPTDRPRPPIQGNRGVRASGTVSPAALDRLKALGLAADATLFMVLMAAVQALLHRITGQTGFAVGTPVAGRKRVETERLIGFFVNSLAIRADLAGDPPFRELLGRVRETAVGAFERQDVPFERLVEELHPERDLSRAPLFQVMLAFQNVPRSPSAGSSFPLEPIPIGGAGAMYDLTLAAAETGQGLTFVLDGNACLFDKTTVQRTLAWLERLLAGIAADPDCRLSELPLTSEAERHQVRWEWNASTETEPGSWAVHRLFEAQARRTPGAVALIFEGGELTYAELDRRANRLARQLRELGVKTETLIQLFLDRSPEMVVALLAVLKAGGFYVPLDPAYPRERLAWMLSDTGAPVLLTRSDLLPLLPESAGERICLDPHPRLASFEVGAGLDPAREGESRRHAIDLSGSSAHPGGDEPLPYFSSACMVPPLGDQLAYAMYTSGSTGRPKGVAVPHRAIVRLVHEGGFAEMGPDDVFLQLAPTSFDASTLEIWGALLHGSRLVLYPGRRVSPEELAETVRQHRVTVLHLTAGLFHQTVEQGLEAFGSVRLLLAGGDVLSMPHVEKALRELPGARFVHAYGPTENTTFTTCHLPSAPGATGRPMRSIPIGRPIHRTRVRLLDPDFRSVPIGVAGELCAGGYGLARGYVNHPELTAERFVPDPLAYEPGERLYRTGDLARYLADGSLEFLGRRDLQVKVRGFRVEPGEVEAALAEHPLVRQAVVVLREDALAAWFVGTAEARELRGFLAERLPEPMVPSRFVRVDALPLSPNGKVDRKALPAPSLDMVQAGDAAPRTWIEELLAQIWAEVLGLERVGVHDDFFELGGHSLLATRVASRVRSALGVELPLRALFEHPTVSRLATSDALRQALGGEPAPPILPVPRDGALPLSFAQERLWFLDQLEPVSPLYNIPAPLRLPAGLRPAVLERALGEVVRRHEALRTTFRTVQGEPGQVIAPAGGWTLPQVDLTALPAAMRDAREGEARRLAFEDARRPFDLARGPLLRTTLLRLGDEADGEVLLLNLHHIVSDGWSMGVLEREVVALYEAFSRGEPSPLPELPVQYADFAVWQRAWLSGAELERQLAFWREHLSGAPAVLELPTDRPRPAVQTYRGAQRSIGLGPEPSAGVKALARREGATLFMVLLGAFAALLSRHTAREDVVVGSPIANRNRAEIEDLIGFFVNTLVLRTDLSGDPGFRELLGRVRRVTLEAYAHQDLPFERLVEELEVERSLSHTPLFQAMLTLQDGAAPAARAGEIRRSEEELAKFDLTLVAEEGPAGLALGVQYNRDLFDGVTIERLLGQCGRLLGAIAEDPARRLSELTLLSEAERQQVRVEWNDTEREPAPEETLPVHLRVAAWASRAPGAAAVETESESLTYAELHRRAAALAERLRGMGIGPESVVAVHMERSPEMVCGLLGVLMAGAAYLPIDPGTPGERVSAILEDCGAAAVLTGPLDGITPLRRPSPSRGEELHPESLAYVIYTSGSTGTPKGVEVTHAGLSNLIGWHLETYRVRPGDRATQLAGLGFDASVWEIWPYLAAGATVRLVPSEVSLDPDALADLLTRERITHAFIPTPLAEGLVAALTSSLSPGREARFLLTGGDRLLRGPDRDLPFRLVNHYGPTESTVVATAGPVPTGAANPAIGRPISNLRVSLLDRSLRPVPIGVPGELHVGGVGLARGYRGRPDLTAERFLPDPCAGREGAGGRLYATGDLARRRPDGGIEFLGRADEQVKVRGVRIELGEVEAALARHPGVREAAVLAREAGPGGRVLVACVVSVGSEATPAALRSFLEERLPSAMVPSGWIFLERMPLTPNGKVDRRALAGLELPAGIAERIEYVAPRTPAEEAIAGLYAELLGIERVGAHDDFFALGGHSLLASRLATRIRERFGVPLPLRQLFESPTPAGLAGILEAMEAVEAAASGPPPASGEAGAVDEERELFRL